MTATAHTPGPWTNNYFTVKDEQGNIVADTLTEGKGSITKEQFEANTRLIAAAPLLHEALTEIMNNQLGGDVWHDAPRFQKARAALAAVVGEDTAR